MSGNPTFRATIDDYLARVPPDTRAALETLRRQIRDAAPGAVEVIAYRMPAFRYLGRILVYFAAFRDHCSLFPASTQVMRRFEKDLEGFGTSGKGTIRFTTERPLPPALVDAIVRARVAEIEAGRTVSRVRGVERRGG